MEDKVCKWAYERMHQKDFVLLDTETTALDGEIIDLAILGPDGETIFDSLIKPVGRIEEGARGVHGISEEMVANAPTFAEVWPRVEQLLAGKIVITYNANFDLSMFTNSMAIANISLDLLDTTWKDRPEVEVWQCLMEKYAHHWGRRTSFGSYQWQRLEAALHQQRLPRSNTHRALADAQAAYSLLAHLASKYTPPAQAEQEKQPALVEKESEQP